MRITAMCEDCNKHILIIEPDSDVRCILSLSLEITTRWKIQTADSSDRALVMLQADCPDAILLDLDVGGTDAFDRLQVAAAPQSIPVVVFASRVRSIDRQKLRELGAAEAISKPFDASQLAEQISQGLNWQYPCNLGNRDLAFAAQP